MPHLVIPHQVCRTTPHHPATHPTTLQHPTPQDMVSERISAKDRLALEYLEDVRYMRGGAGMVVEFHFANNPYFENKVGPGLGPGEVVGGMVMRTCHIVTWYGNLHGVVIYIWE